MTAARPSRLFWLTAVVLAPGLNVALAAATAHAVHSLAGSLALLGGAWVMELFALDTWLQAGAVEKRRGHLLTAGIAIAAMTAVLGYGAVIAVLMIVCGSDGCG